MNPSPVPVLISCVGASLSPRTLELLSRHSDPKLRIVGIDTDAGAIGARWADAFYRVPPGDHPDYIEAVLDICAREDVRVMVPWSDEEAFAVAGSQDRFRAAGVACNVPPSHLLAILKDKGKVFGWLEPSVPVAPYRTVTTPDLLDEAVHALGYPEHPVVVKPARSRGNRGIWTLAAKEDRSAVMSQKSVARIDLQGFHQLIDADPPVEMLCMPWLPGPIYDVDVLADGERIRRAVSRRRVNDLGTPFLGCYIEDPPAVRKVALDIAAAVGPHAWLYDLDIALDRDGTPFLLEINPRPSGSAVAVMEAGISLLHDLIRVLLGEPITDDAVPPPTEIRPYAALLKIQRSGG